MQCIDLVMTQFSTPRLSRNPRERYLIYYRDLAQCYGVEFVESSVYQGGQYSAIELIHPVMETLSKRNDFQKIGFCIIADWAPDFDADHSAFGPLVMESWQLNSKLYNLLDQGILSFITALKLAYQLSLIQSVLILSIEQTTVPQFKGIEHFQPAANGAVGMLFSGPQASNNKHDFSILASDITELQSEVLILFLVEKFTLNQNEIKKIHVLNNGMMFMYKALSEIYNQYSPGYYLVLIQDIETSSRGYILIHKEINKEAHHENF